MKIKVFLTLLAFASTAFGQAAGFLECPNATTVSKFVNPYKNLLNLQNLDYTCDSVQSKYIIDDVLVDDPLVNPIPAYMNVSFTGVCADGQLITFGPAVIEFDTNGSVTGSNIRIDVSGGVTASQCAGALMSKVSNFFTAESLGDIGGNPAVRLIPEINGTTYSGEYSSTYTETGTNITVLDSADGQYGTADVPVGIYLSIANYSCDMETADDGTTTISCPVFNNNNRASICRALEADPNGGYSGSTDEDGGYVGSQMPFVCSPLLDDLTPFLVEQPCPAGMEVAVDENDFLICE